MVFFQDSILCTRWFGLVCVVLVCARESIILCSKSLCQMQIFILKIHFYSNGRVCIGRLPVRRQMQQVLGIAR